jgi:hypothetical protein
MEYPKGARVWKQGVWKQIVATLRCPYCVEGRDFRPMVELSGRRDGVFFCSECHHVAGPSEAAFNCECVNCRNLRRESGPGNSRAGH